MRAVPTDVAEYHRLRWRARRATLAVLLVAAWLVYRMVRIVGQDGDDTRLAMVPYLGLCLLGAVAWFVVRPRWLASLAARPRVQTLDPTPGELYGIPELDEPPQRHRGLSGVEKPPVRW